MAEEFQAAGICGGNWWLNPSRSVLAGGPSPCSVAVTADMATGFGWPPTSDHVVDLKMMQARCYEETSANPNNNNTCSNDNDNSVCDSGGSNILMDSTLQMMGFDLSSSTSSDWNQSFFRGNGRAERNYSSTLQEEMNSRTNYQQETGNTDSSQIQKGWNPNKNFTSMTGEDSCNNINSFKLLNQDFSLDQLRSSPMTSFGYPSNLIQSLFEPEPEPQPQQSSLFNNRSINYTPIPNNYASDANETPVSWPKMAPFMKPSLPKAQLQPNSLQFTNNTAFWNASATGMNDVRASLLASSQSQFISPSFEEKTNCVSLKTKASSEEVREMASVMKKGNNEPAIKRPRIETPSPLPTFKVRKEKLGDRITALQQLVSPFGKTDTASVLHEAIDYIKFLHDQVNVLSTPYMKQGSPPQQHNCEKLKDPEGLREDLRSRGLCIVPISSTFPVANETTADFWTPTFGGTFR